APHSLAPLMTAINRIRRENPALHGDWSLEFHETDNPSLLAYSKLVPGGTNHVLVVVNLDPHTLHHGFVRARPERFGVPPGAYWAEDLLTGERYRWQGDWNYVRLDPRTAVPAHVLRLEA
ncbi:MAG TPA: alpha-1,4-glucan--maltose-1-phosphate maltosyltransferase, partial [Methylomirabilota bacterium]